MNFYNILVRTGNSIDLFSVLFHNINDILLSKFGGISGIIIHNDKSHQFIFCILKHKTLKHKRHIIQFCLNLLRVYILTIRAEKHILITTADIDSTIFVHSTHISGMQPTLFINNSFSSLLIFIISHHHILTTNNDFSHFVMRVGREDFSLHTRQHFTNGIQFIFVPERVTDKRSALRHTIADGKAKTDFLKELFRLRIHWRTTDDNLFKFTTKSLGEFTINGGKNSAIQERNHHSPTHCALLHHRLNLLTINFLNNKRHGKNTRRFYLGKCL